MDLVDVWYCLRDVCISSFFSSIRGSPVALLEGSCWFLVEIYRDGCGSLVWLDRCNAWRGLLQERWYSGCFVPVWENKIGSINKEYLRKGKNYNAMNFYLLSNDKVILGNCLQTDCVSLEELYTSETWFINRSWSDAIVMCRLLFALFGKSLGNASQKQKNKSFEKLLLLVDPLLPLSSVGRTRVVYEVISISTTQAVNSNKIVCVISFDHCFY